MSILQSKSRRRRHDDDDDEGIDLEEAEDMDDEEGYL